MITKANHYVLKINDKTLSQLRFHINFHVNEFMEYLQNF